MQKDYFRRLIELYDESGIVKKVNILNPAYKRTALSIWANNDEITISNGYGILYEAERIQNGKVNHGEIVEVFETGDYQCIIDILAICGEKKDNYRELLEDLDTYINSIKEIVLVKK